MLLLGYILLLAFVFFFEMLRKKYVFVDFILLFNVYFVFSYLIPAIAFLSASEQFSEWRFLAIVPQSMDSFLVFFAVLIGYLAIIVGYQIGVKQNANVYPNIGFKYGEKTQLALVMVFFLIISFAFFAYAYGHGGIIELILSGKDIRAGRQSAGVYQYAEYFSQGLPLSMLLFYSFKKYARKQSIRSFTSCFFLLSFPLSLINAVGTAGRGKIGFVFLLFLFFWWNFDGPKISKKKIFTMLFFLLFVFFLVTFGKSAIWTLHALSDGPIAYLEAFQRHRELHVETGGIGFSGYLTAFARNVDHGLVSVYLALHNPEIYQTPRLFFDWPRAFIDIVPGISQPEFIVSSTPSGLNRDFLGVEGHVPPGWVAMKIINGGVFWLLAGSLIAGFIGGYLNRVLYQSWHSSPIMPALFIYIAFFWKDYIVGTDPFMFVLPNLSTFLILALLVWMFVIRKEGNYRGSKHFT